jgi:hypothetical protein
MANNSLSLWQNSAADDYAQARFCAAETASLPLGVTRYNQLPFEQFHISPQCFSDVSNIAHPASVLANMEPCDAPAVRLAFQLAVPGRGHMIGKVRVLNTSSNSGCTQASDRQGC